MQSFLHKCRLMVEISYIPTLCVGASLATNFATKYNAIVFARSREPLLIQHLSVTYLLHEKRTAIAVLSWWR